MQPVGRLLVVTVGEAFRAAVAELTAAHEPSHIMRSQGNCRTDRPGFPVPP
jgi:hypothetical protein